jgi:hypothetical protein
VIRALRIGALALALPLLFALSQRVSAARGQEPVPGISWALGALSVLFLVRALVTERMRGAEANRQKDLLWGVGAGCIITILSRC